MIAARKPPPDLAERLHDVFFPGVTYGAIDRERMKRWENIAAAIADVVRINMSAPPPPAPSPLRPRALPTNQAAIELVLDVMGVDASSLYGTGRSPQVVDARWTLICLLRLMGRSFPEIGREMGKTNHSTAGTAFKAAGPRHRACAEILHRYLLDVVAAVRDSGGCRAQVRNRIRDELEKTGPKPGAVHSGSA